MLLHEVTVGDLNWSLNPLVTAQFCSGAAAWARALCQVLHVFSAARLQVVYPGGLSMFL